MLRDGAGLSVTVKFIGLPSVADAFAMLICGVASSSSRNRAGAPIFRRTRGSVGMVAAPRDVQIERLVVVIRVLVGVNGNSETAPPRTDANRLLCCSVIVAAFSGRVAAIVG